MKAMKSYIKRIATISLAAVLVFSTVSTDHFVTYASDALQEDTGGGEPQAPTSQETPAPESQEPQAPADDTLEEIPSEEGLPDGEEEIPSEEGLPVGEEEIPAGEEVLPASEEVLPADEEGLPAGEEGLPIGEEGLPSEEGIPVGEDGLPIEGELPLEGEELLEGEAPIPEIILHKVAFLGMDGGILAEVDVADGEGATAPTPPELEGYQFTGWNADFSVVTSDLTIQATYELLPEVIRYQVTFLGMNDIILAEIAVDEGMELAAEQIPVAPVVEGFEFTGWDIAPEGLIVNSDLTITAQYTALVKTFAVTFLGMNGEILSVVPVPEMTEIAPEAIPVPPIVEGYHFVAWDKELGAITEDLIVKAVYEDDFPAFEQSVTLGDGTMITAKADRGIVPRGAQLEAGEVTLSETQTDAVDAAVGEEVEQFAYDIKIRQTDGSEFEPASQESVQIIFSNIEGIEEAENVAIAYVEGDQANVEAQEAKNGSEAVFAASHFSVYVVAISATIENISKNLSITNGSVVTLGYILDEFYDDATMNRITITAGSFTNVSTPATPGVITLSYLAGNKGMDTNLTAASTGSAVITFRYLIDRQGAPDLNRTATVNITVGEYHYQILKGKETYAGDILAKLGINYSGNYDNGPRFTAITGSGAAFYSFNSSSKKITASQASKEAIVTIQYKPEGESKWIEIQVILNSYSKYTHFALVTTTTDDVTIDSLVSVKANGGGYSNTNIPMGARQNNGLGEYEFQSSSMNYSFTHETSFTVVANIHYTPHYYLNGVLQDGATVYATHTFTISDYQYSPTKTFYEYSADTYCVGGADNKGIDVKTTYGEIINQFFSVVYSLDESITTVMDSTHYEEGDEITLLGLPADYSQTGKVFTGWRSSADNTLYDPGDIVIMGNSQITFTAEFRTSFIVTWMVNGEQKEQDNNVAAGAFPIYDQADPTKSPSGGFAYIFRGWNTNAAALPAAALLEAALPAVQGDITYHAIFEKVNLYTVTWRDGRTVWEFDRNVMSGSRPDYENRTPFRMPIFGRLFYTFVGWSLDPDAEVEDALPVSELPDITGNTTFHAIFRVTRIMNPDFDPYDGLYDGEYHGLSITDLPTGAQVFYSTETPLNDGNVGEEGTLAGDPTQIMPYLNAGRYTIYYYITAPGYLTERGSREVRIRPIRINISAEGLPVTKVYDGNTSVPELLLQSEGLLPGHFIRYEGAYFNSPDVSVAEFVTVFGIRIMSGEGEVPTDETGNYNIRFREGGLRLPGTITLRPFTLTAGSASKVYDGLPLTNPDYAITSGSLVEGHELIAETEGSQTEPGTSFNTISFNIFAQIMEDGEEQYSVAEEEAQMQEYAVISVSENYDVTTVSGNLTVTAAPGPGPTPGPTPTPTPTPTPVVVIEPEPAPLANTLPPSTIIIDEAPVALARVPAAVVEEEPIDPTVVEEPEEEPLEEIEEPEVPLAQIEEDEVPLAPGIDEICWIHWLILILTAFYTLYEVARGLARKKRINELAEAQESKKSHTTA